MKCLKRNYDNYDEFKYIKNFLIYESLKEL